MSQSDPDPDEVAFSGFRSTAWRWKHGQPISVPMRARLDRVWQKALPPAQRQSLAHVIRQWNRAEAAASLARQSVAEAQNYHVGVDGGFVSDLNVPTLEDYHDALRVWQRAMNDAMLTLMTLKSDMRNVDRCYDIKNSGCNEYVEIWMENLKELLDWAVATVDKLPEPDHEAIAKRKEAKRIAEGNLGPAWVGHWPLAEGSFGAATLHLKQDASGQVIDRLVIKDSIFQEHSVDCWQFKELWTGADGGPEDLNSIPIEIQAMKDLRDKVGSGSVVNLRNWKLSRQNRSHRLYMDYCPHGDMFDLLELEPYLSHALKRRENRMIVRKTAVLYPEPLAWYCFWSLATAGLLMERGTLVQDDTPSSKWSVIVHRDMKLCNVFLGPASKDHFRCYPQPKVGDFGLSIMLPDQDTRTAESFQKAGTASTQAPEQGQNLYDTQGAVKKMSAKTNVFGIGITMWSLIRHTGGFDTTRTDWTDPSKHDLKPWLDATARKFYSADLIGLIDRCVRFDDDERPTMDEVMNEILSFTGDGPVDHAKGLRSAAADDPIWEDYKLLNLFDKEQYKLRMPLKENFLPEGKIRFPSPPPPHTGDGPLPEDDLGGPEGMDYVLPRAREGLQQKKG